MFVSDASDDAASRRTVVVGMVLFFIARSVRFNGENERDDGFYKSEM